MDETPSGEKSTDKMNPGQQVGHDVQKTIEHLREGRTTTREAENVRDAATRAIADKFAARAIR